MAPGRSAGRPGHRLSLVLTRSVTGVIAGALYAFAPGAVRLFSPDPSVIEYGVLFIRTNTAFLLFNCVNHVLAGALRGRGDSRGPMILMLTAFVGIRQVYLYLVTHFVANTPRIVGFGYPVGWTCCFILELSYYLLKRKKEAERERTAPAE